MGRAGPPRFANILLGGRCNLRCPGCIGQTMGPGARVDSLSRWPLPGLERFVELLANERITEVSLTGANTDPLLYGHNGRLLAWLRRRLPGVNISLHTNGLLAVARAALVNRFDRVCLSVPSLVPQTCGEITGRAVALDLAAVIQQVQVPLKISTLVTPANADQVPRLVARCGALGLRRLVLRRLRWPDHAPAPPLVARWLADTSAWVRVQQWLSRAPLERWYGGNPVYRVDGVEVTLWDFGRAELRCVNLLADGSITGDYLLEQRRKQRTQSTEHRAENEERRAPVFASMGAA